jgi:hypothetical protein
MTDLSQSNTYPTRLRRLKQTLEQQAYDAERRRIYGLAERLAEAAASCGSWADSIEQEEHELGAAFEEAG